jgi:hypothetical protein
VGYPASAGHLKLPNIKKVGFIEMRNKHRVLNQKCGRSALHGVYAGFLSGCMKYESTRFSNRKVLRCAVLLNMQLK